MASCDTLIVIAGPTAVGKTDVSVGLAERLGCEILSADSRQVYEEMRIGTAVPAEEVLERVPHHFVRCRSVWSPINAYDFEHEAMRILPDVFRRGGGLAILAGGSMMYVDALCRGIDPMPDVPAELRVELKAQLEREGLEAMVGRLRRLDPEYCEVADLRNQRRVLHALEVCLASGATLTSLRRGVAASRPFKILKFALVRPREELYCRIDKRVDQMMDDGLLREVESLRPLEGLQPLQTVGYRELFGHLDGDLSLDEAVALIKRNTRRYAKKQLTWINADDQYCKLSPDGAEKKIVETLAELKTMP